jgi:hypothetical protein
MAAKKSADERKIKPSKLFSAFRFKITEYTQGFITLSTLRSKYSAGSDMPGMLLNKLQNRFDVCVPTWNFRTLGL